MFDRTIAINKILGLLKRIKVIQGGTWAGKTYGIVAVIINCMIVNPGRSCTVVAETVPALKQGALKDFKEIMVNTKRWDDDNYNIAERKYTFSNGSTIQFSSFDTVGKALSAGKRSDLFLNEAYFIPFDIADALIGRTWGNVWIDYNPHTEFWVHTEVLTRDDACFLLLKYSDNNQLPQAVFEDLMAKQAKAFHDPLKSHTDESNIKNHFWANWCRVYIDGLLGILEGAVFKDWKQIDELPMDAIRIGEGMDFGFTNDPSTLISLYRHDENIIYDECIYEKGLLSGPLADKIKSHNPKNYLVVADSENPQLIAEIKAKGINIIGAKKGPGSVKFGIDIMQEHGVIVTSRSVNMIKELRNYRWEKDRHTGMYTQEPIDAFNHAIDGARYAASFFLKSKRPVQISWGDD